MDVPAGPRLDDQLCFALYAATNAITRAYRPLLGALNLTYSQYLVLMVLWQDNEATVQAIATRLQLGSNAVTPLIDRLQAADLVVRRTDATDRRVVHVGLTPSGSALRDAAATIQQEVTCSTGLSPAAVNELRGDLIALTNRIAPTG